MCNCNYHGFLSALGGLINFFSALGTEKLLGCGLLGGISTQDDTMNTCAGKT